MKTYLILLLLGLIGCCVDMHVQAQVQVDLCGPSSENTPTRPSCKTEFSTCAARTYYRRLSSPSSEDWTREELQALVNSTHVNVLSMDGITEALMELDAAVPISSGSEGEDEMQVQVQMIYSQEPRPATDYIQPDGWRMLPLWPSVSVGATLPLDVHSIRAETTSVSADLAGLLFGVCGTVQSLELCTSPATAGLPLDTAADELVFAPPVSVRGDIARALFFMDLKYPSLQLTDCNLLQDNDNDNYNTFGILNQLLIWHMEDPVSQEEANRNDQACQFWQGNRNPFVDYPNLVEQLFGPPNEFPEYNAAVKFPWCSSNDTVTLVDENENENENDNIFATIDTDTLGGNETNTTNTTNIDIDTGIDTDTSDPCAQLQPGDIMIYSVNSIEPQFVDFLTLEYLPPGLVLYMTDYPWDGNDFINANANANASDVDSTQEGTLKWAVPFAGFGYLAGSSFRYVTTPSTERWVVDQGNFTIGRQDGDSIVLYCRLAEDDSIRPLVAFNNYVLGWAASGLSPNDYGTGGTAEIQELVPVGSVSLNHFDNYRYIGPDMGDKQELQEYMVDPNYWEGSDDGLNETEAPTLLMDDTDDDDSIGGTVWDILTNNSESALFSEALEFVNMDILLDDPVGIFTVFAPSNDAVAGEERLQVYSSNLLAWKQHLTNVLENHIVTGLALTLEDLDAGGSQEGGLRLNTIAGEILLVDEDVKVTVSGGLFQFSNRTVASAELISSNGVVHLIDDFLATTWYEQTLVEVLAAADILDLGLSFLYDLMVIADLIDDAAFTEVTENGATLVAPSDDAYELAGVETVADEVTGDDILYLVVDSNINPDDLENNTSILVSTRHPVAQLWLTKDEMGVLRYNDAVFEEVLFANNGLIHVVDKVITPPTILEFLGFAMNYTTVQVTILQKFLEAVNTSFDSLSEDIDSDQLITLFAPVDGNFETLSAVDQDRLLLPLWSRHLGDMILNLITPQSYTRDELFELARSESSLDTAGRSSLILVESGGGVGIGSGSLLDFPSPAGTDGIVHFVNGMTFAQSVTTHTNELIDSPEILVQVIQDTDLSAVLGGSDPVTFLWPTDYADLNTTLSTDEVNDIIQNHIFEGLYFSDELLEMDGEIVTSINDKEWVISVLDGQIFFGSEMSGDVVALELDVDILTKTGVVHRVDGILSEMSGTEPPSLSPTLAPTPTEAPDSETTETIGSGSGTGDTAQQGDSVILSVNASFAVFNLQDLSDTDLASRSNEEILNEAFSDFVVNLVTEVEGRQQAGRNRRLIASFVQGSADIFAVATVPCTAVDAAPNEAICHNVYGDFDLSVIDESTDAVAKRYADAAQQAIRRGDLQSTLAEVDPKFPFYVAGSAVTSDANGDPQEDEPEFWIIIILVLVGFAGCGCILFACSLLFLQHKPDDPENDAYDVLLEQNEKRETSDDSSANKEEEGLLDKPEAVPSPAGSTESLEQDDFEKQVDLVDSGLESETERSLKEATREESQHYSRDEPGQPFLQSSTHIEFRPDDEADMVVSSAKQKSLEGDDAEMHSVQLNNDEWEDEPQPQTSGSAVGTEEDDSWGENAASGPEITPSDSGVGDDESWEDKESPTSQGQPPKPSDDGDSWGEEEAGDEPNEEDISWDDGDDGAGPEDISWEDEEGDNENLSELQNELRVANDADTIQKGVSDESGKAEYLLDFTSSPKSKSTEEAISPADITNSFDSSWNEGEEAGVVGLQDGIMELKAELEGFDRHFLP